MKKTVALLALLLVGDNGSLLADNPVPQDSGGKYVFRGGYPTPETIRRARDDADLDRAVSAYRFFYPVVSGVAIFQGNRDVGIVPNKSFGTLDTQPRHLILTANSDTPYAPILLDLKDGPMVVELPPGPLICLVMDLGQRWVADLGMPGPDGDKGGKYLLVPPGYRGTPPPGFRVLSPATFHVLVGIRSLPVGGDVPAAIERIKGIRVHPLNPGPDWTAPVWKDLTPLPQDTTAGKWEDNLEFWRVLHDVVVGEPLFEAFKDRYGDLAELGIVKGKPFAPDERMKGILERAARIGCGQMRVESFADARPDRVVWPDRRWEWASLRYEDGDFNTPDYLDTYAREKWFFQAIGASPAMFRRNAGAGSLYWLGLRDRSGAYLYGDKTYKLEVPLPVPGNLFWSVTVYDAETRSQIQTAQGKAALRSLFELKGQDRDAGKTLTLYFGPKAPPGHEGQWIQTLPGKGWFVYFRIYGPGPSAFDGSWKPGDFEESK